MNAMYLYIQACGKFFQRRTNKLLFNFFLLLWLNRRFSYIAYRYSDVLIDLSHFCMNSERNSYDIKHFFLFSALYVPRLAAHCGFTYIINVFCGSIPHDFK